MDYIQPHFFRKYGEWGRVYILFILYFFPGIAVIFGILFGLLNNLGLALLFYLFGLSFFFIRPFKYFEELKELKMQKLREEAQKQREDELKKELEEKKKEKEERDKELEREQELARIELERQRKLQREKGLYLFEGKWVDKKEIPKLKEIKIGLDNNFKNISPYEFENFIAKLFTAMGYKTQVTKKSGDYGIDVIAKKDNDIIAIQAKKYHDGNPVGNRDVQRLLGAMQLKDVKANHSIIITTSHFTVQAREQAKECAIELWSKEDLHKMVRKYLMEI
jgi:HJR/Mrr/RecB family endonuclease